MHNSPNLDVTGIEDPHGVLKNIIENNAILSGHFKYAGGQHGHVYLAKKKITPDTRYMMQYGEVIAVEFVDDRINAVVSPAYGAIGLGTLTATALMGYVSSDVLNFYATKITGDNFALETDHLPLLKPGMKVLIVEDIITTGSSVKKVAKLIRECGAEVFGVGCLWNRGGVTADDLGVKKLCSLVTHQFPAYAPEECPLCQAGIPINEDHGRGGKK